MSRRPFEPGRLRLARELKEWSQTELARRLGVSAAALSQFESGATQPSAHTLTGLARLLGTPSTFFALPLAETHEGFFRSLRRTTVASRRRARAIAHIAHDLASDRSTDAELATPSVPQFPYSALSDELEDVERIAAKVRRRWKIQAGPAPNLVELLETHGVLVIRLPLDSADVDAFSLPFQDRPVVVLGSDKNDKARSRFDSAHELGHLIMHGDQMWGLPQIEKQAHRFAAAFLMPGRDIYDELPERADWPRLFELKRKWQVSLAALVMRARTLGRMSERNYVAAVKAMSARGWRRVEPVPLGVPEQPNMFPRLLSSARSAKVRASLPHPVIDALASALAVVPSRARFSK